MRHALVVDDRPEICDVLKMGLETLGAFRVTCAETAHDAISTLLRDPPNVAIIDVMMRGIGGLGLARYALQYHIPVLLMTGAPIADDRLQTIDCPHILKPFRLSELIRATEDVLVDPQASRAKLRAALDRVDCGWSPLMDHRTAI